MAESLAAAPAVALKNKAFLFIKPHAVTDATKTLVGAQLVEKGFTICSEGSISAEDIDSKQLIDQHYYAIASKATILKPNELNIPKEKFKEQFGRGFYCGYIEIEGKEPFYTFNGFFMSMRSKFT